MQNPRQVSHTVVAPHELPSRQQVTRFVAAVFDPDDVVEIRRVQAKKGGSARSAWHKVSGLSDLVDGLQRDNGHGQHIFFGANPRPKEGAKGDACIESAHCLFADFDGGCTLEDARKYIQGALLPDPTVMVFSGHGVHAYWRFEERMLDMEAWRSFQDRLAVLLCSDRAIKNPERLMRLPGFRNHKAPPADCYLAECDPDRTCAIDIFLSRLPNLLDQRKATAVSTVSTSDAPEVSIDRIIDAGRYANGWPGVGEGERNSASVYHAAQLCHDFQLPKSAAWPILKAWNATNNPPLSDEELKSCLVNGERYGGKPEYIRPKVGAPIHVGPLWFSLSDLHNMPTYRAGLQPVTTGFELLDKALNGGFRPANTYVIGGRTGSAKSTLAANIVRRAALSGVSTLLLKLEETPIEAVWRMHAATAHVPLRRLLDGPGMPGNEDTVRLDNAWQVMSDLPIRISGEHNLNHIRRIVKEHAEQAGQLVVIDQLSGVSVTGASTSFERATLVSNTMRELASDHYIPIVMVCQVNREGAKTARTGRPDSARRLDAYDLRDSGAIENDAAAVLMIDGVDRNETPTRPEYCLRLLIAKNRYGRITTPADDALPLVWDPVCCRIDDAPMVGAP